MRLKPVTLWFAVSLVVVVLDFLSKRYVSQIFMPGEEQVVTDFFSLVLVHNEGAAFSFLATAGGWQRYFLSILAAGACGLMSYWLYRFQHDRLFCGALALILGGALGNLYDRLCYGHVIDFLLFHYQHWAWPAFNLADSAITLGAGLMLADALARKKPV